MALVNTNQPVLLMVEGKEDIRFFVALIKYMKLENIQVNEYEGKTKMRGVILALKKERMFLDNVIALGVVRDADNNAADTFQSVSSTLKKAGLQVPTASLKASPNLGTFGDPQVSVMIVPTDSTTGMLEDVCFASVELEKEIISCVDQYFSCLPQKLDSHVIPKAKLQVYLAAKKPELRLGEAAEKGLWNWEHPVFDPMKDFLRQLSAIPQP